MPVKPNSFESIIWITMKNRKVDVTITPFQKSHEQGVIDLIVHIQQNEFNLPITASDQPDLKDVKGVYQKGAGNFWVAYHGDEILGTIALLDIGYHRAALRKMFVRASSRGEAGIAKKLLRVLIQWARTHGIREVFLGTTPKFLAAHRFYEKNRFREIDSKELPRTFPVMKVDTKFYKYEIEV